MYPIIGFRLIPSCAFYSTMMTESGQLEAIVSIVQGFDISTVY